MNSHDTKHNKSILRRWREKQGKKISHYKSMHKIINKKKRR